MALNFFCLLGVLSSQFLLKNFCDNGHNCQCSLPFRLYFNIGNRQNLSNGFRGQVYNTVINKKQHSETTFGRLGFAIFGGYWFVYFTRTGNRMESVVLSLGALLIAFFAVCIYHQSRFAFSFKHSQSSRLQRLTISIAWGLPTLFFYYISIANSVFQLNIFPFVDPPLLELSAMWLHMGFLLLYLNYDDAIYLPIPPSMAEMSTAWLTKALHHSGLIDRTTKVTSFSGNLLTGGCHYKVSKLNLEYSPANAEGPRTVVVKLLSWNKPLWEKVVLYIKFLLAERGFLDKDAMYLVSYQIESIFYREYCDNIRGLSIPKAYYNIEDCFNNRFGMVMQDISMTIMYFLIYFF
jgi:hypothetical protein